MLDAVGSADRLAMADKYAEIGRTFGDKLRWRFEQAVRSGGCSRLRHLGSSVTGICTSVAYRKRREMSCDVLAT